MTQRSPRQNRAINVGVERGVADGRYSRVKPVLPTEVRRIRAGRQKNPVRSKIRWETDKRRAGVIFRHVTRDVR